MKENSFSIDEISEEDWQRTPERVKQLVINLIRRIEQLEQQYAELKAENELLKEQLKQNSQNSSKPPSQDGKKGFKAREKKAGKKKRGGQPGHEGHERALYSPEECQSIEEHYPEHCIECGERLEGEDPEPYRVQVVEIPKVRPEVVEHRFHCLKCHECGQWTRGWNDRVINGSGYGERVAAHVAVLSGQYRQSHRMVQSLLDELFGIRISVGSINQLRQESCQAMASVVEVAHHYVRACEVVHVDETSFVQHNGDGHNPSERKGWLWVIATPLVSYFEVFLGRSQAVCQQLLGKNFNGIVSSDRCGAYNKLDLEKRQICWAHLKRDFTRIAERSDPSTELGRSLLAQQKLLFEQWHRVRDGTMSRAEFIQVVAPIREQVQSLLQQGADTDIAGMEKTPWAKTIRTCRQLLKVEPALWTFVTTEGVEPTNNAAERALRPAVLWRKTSFGSHSHEGSLFVSRILTVVTTLRSQNRPVLEFLVEVCRAARQGQTPPSLLPISAATP